MLAVIYTVSFCLCSMLVPPAIRSAVRASQNLWNRQRSKLLLCLFCYLVFPVWVMGLSRVTQVRWVHWAQGREPGLNELALRLHHMAALQDPSQRAALSTRQRILREHERKNGRAHWTRGMPKMPGIPAVPGRLFLSDRQLTVITWTVWYYTGKYTIYLRIHWCILYPVYLNKCFL